MKLKDIFIENKPLEDPIEEGKFSSLAKIAKKLTNKDTVKRVGRAADMGTRVIGLGDQAVSAKSNWDQASQAKQIGQLDVDDKTSEVDFNKQKRAIELQKMQGEQNEDEGFIPPPTKDNKGLDTERIKASAKKGFDTSMDYVVHPTLDLLGLIPGYGAVADVTNAGLHAARGNKADAALSLAAAIPGAGQLATGAKYAGKGAKLAGKATKTLKASNDNPDVDMDEGDDTNEISLQQAMKMTGHRGGLKKSVAGTQALSRGISGGTQKQFKQRNTKMARATGGSRRQVGGRKVFAGTQKQKRMGQATKALQKRLGAGATKTLY